MIPGAEDLSISSKSVQGFVQDKADEIRQNIFSEIKCKLLSLKVDVGSVKFRRFLGLSIQYIHEDKMILRHLGVIELHQYNTGTYLKKSVMGIFGQYGIQINQIHSITTDNGSNMLCVTREVNGVLEEEFYEIAPIDEDDYKQLVAELQFLAPSETKPTVFAVRSAAHTLQSAVDDACIEQQELFQTVREAARVLRLPNLASELKSQKFSHAVIDNPVRWDSTAYMLERFITLKSFCEDSSDEFLNLPESSWIEIRNTLKVLRLCKKLLKRIQKEQLTFGDFFILWTQCVLKLEKVATPFALRVLLCMKKHQDTLFASTSFLEALYLDPRVNFFLTETQATLARNHLIKTFQKLDELNRTTGVPLQPSTSKNEKMSLEMESDDSNNSFLFMEVKQEIPESENSHTNTVDDYFRNIYLERQRQNNTRTECEIFFPLLEFMNEPYLSTDENILEFWRKRKVTHSQLYTLACTVLSTPPTQVSVERLFSVLENILTDQRMSLNDKVINDLLVIRCYYSYN
ncbi:hypothetical protein NE865_04313 [Phthorimaea operculella]|nr:hypothetical protein NE865_04313 [Phthorimaea operculella]